MSPVRDGLVERVERITAEAGRLAREISRSGYEVEEKEDEDPVTRADREADRLLRRELLQLVECAWISEEIGADPGHWEERRAWIVDPIDGTVDFIDGVPDWTVSVALVVDGGVRLGVVHNPGRNETYLAERGAGAWRRKEAGLERLAVREGIGLALSPREVARLGADTFGAGWELVALGSTAYRLARAAAGDMSATVSISDKKEWDVAAGALLVEEAGGRVSDRTGEALRFNRRDPSVRGILAGATGAWERLRDLFSSPEPPD